MCAISACEHVHHGGKGGTSLLVGKGVGGVGHSVVSRLPSR